MPAINFTPFPLISTDRLLLRQLDEQDANEIFIHRSDERILKYIQIQKADSIGDALAFIEKINRGIGGNEWIYWGITLKNDRHLVGTICLWNIDADASQAEIGYVLHPDFQGKGLMQEAVSEVIKYAFEKVKLHIIEAVLHKDNIRSIKLLERNNFSKQEISDVLEHNAMLTYRKIKSLILFNK